MRTVWSAAIPRELATAAKPFVTRYLPSLPCWVERFDVEYDAEAGDADETVYLRVFAQEEMRTATLNLRAEWLTLDDVQRDELMAHEFAHIPALPAFNLASQVLAECSAAKLLVEQFDSRVEAATQDYAKILRKAYGK